MPAPHEIHTKTFQTRAARDFLRAFEQAAPPERFCQMQSMSRFASAAKIALLRHIVTSDASALVRHEAAFLLGQHGSLAEANILERVLAIDRNFLVRHEAALALAAIGSRESMPILQRGLLDRNTMVAQSCAAALCLLEAPNSIAPRRIDVNP
jgi:HEAT repeat protein